jgi:hypothetical protein
MNVKLQYDLDFMAGIWYEGQMQMNHYSLSMNLLTQTMDSAATNVAMDRLKYFVLTHMQNTVFISQEHIEVAELLKSLGVNVTTLPGEPVDQLIGIMLYCKLNAIMEGRMTVDSLNLASRLGDQVWYLHDAEDSLGMFAVDGWWHSPSAQHHTLNLDAYPANVIQVAPSAWIEHGLLWPEVAAESSGNTVVFGKFPKNAN